MLNTWDRDGNSLVHVASLTGNSRLFKVFGIFHDLRALHCAHISLNSQVKCRTRAIVIIKVVVNPQTTKKHDLKTIKILGQIRLPGKYPISQLNLDMSAQCRPVVL